MSRLVVALLLATAAAGLDARRIDQAASPATALDVSILLDVSGSVTGPFGDTLAAGARAIPGMLDPEDKSELIVFDSEVRRSSDVSGRIARQPPRIADGGTRLFDAILTAAMEKDSPGRRHVIVALTDGLDTASLIDRATRVAVLRRSKAVVNIVALSLSGRRSGFIPMLPDVNDVREEEGDYDYLLREITDATGGQLHDIHFGDAFVESLRADLDRARK